MKVPRSPQRQCQEPLDGDAIVSILVAVNIYIHMYMYMYIYIYIYLYSFFQLLIQCPLGGT